MAIGSSHAAKTAVAYICIRVLEATSFESVCHVDKQMELGK